MKKHTLALLVPLFSVSLLSGCIIHVGGDADEHGNASTVFGGIDIGNDRQVGDLSTVNGGIDIGHRSQAGDVTTVNGGIELGDNVVIEEAETVNGSITAGHNLQAHDDLQTVNGRIELQKGARVGGDISTVNGDILLLDAEVGKDLQTLNGDIKLRGDTYIKGDVVFERRRDQGWDWNSDEEPTLLVEKAVRIDGRIILEKPVRLKLENPEMQDKVERRYNDK
ncbi:hypothetical protein [Bowmanella denitrificans]|uniref:hypothetical protein n=1 Tax=Bowmanella denitrificans TaxID=366582 RepID=UPI000C9A7F7B|nr:hypothetical protein [Bowmanella denitrificans]